MLLQQVVFTYQSINTVAGFIYEFWVCELGKDEIFPFVVELGEMQVTVSDKKGVNSIDFIGVTLVAVVGNDGHDSSDVGW